MTDYLIRLAETGRETHGGRRRLRADVAASIAERIVGAAVVDLGPGRMLASTPGPAEAELAAIHGIVSFSPCAVCRLPELEAEVVALARRAIAPGRSFRIRVKRVGTHPFTSQQLAGRLAERVKAALPDARVSLDAPEVTLGVEVRDQDCHVFDRVVAGVDRRDDLEPPPLEGARFLVDQMLRPLATWLAMCGFDAAYAHDLADSELLRRARAEGRLILTRDRALADTPSANTLFVHATEVGDQLREVLAALGLRIEPEAVLSRCTVCNAPIEPVAVARVAARLPRGIAELHHDFWECRRCGRVYWAGLHYDRIRTRLQELGVTWPRRTAG